MAAGSLSFLGTRVSPAHGAPVLFTGSALPVDIRLNHVGGREKTDAAVPAFLTVQSVRPVILNAIGTEERACYQYTCADEAGEPYQICVNAKTGEQEQILLPDEVWIEAGTQ